ncbi:MAG: hypothetical protein HQK61_06100 [Desulfamplus sp.]|nr:hypothetical protein [Desulfamplus sp.]
MIEIYFFNLEAVIKEFPNVRSISLKKKIYNVKQGYINGSIIFENGHRLAFVEVKDTDVKTKIKYSYQYMDEKSDFIFRYDNAPHHHDITNFPHHKHEFDTVKASFEPTLYNILLEIFKKQRKL